MPERNRATQELPKITRDQADRLRDRIEELEEVVGLTAEVPVELIPRELVSDTVGKPVLLKIIGMLLVRPYWSREAMYSALYGSRPEWDQPSPQILDVYLCRARATLRSHGVEIKTTRAPEQRGWYLEEKDKARLREKIRKLKEAA